jgi:cytochrome c biogenesis protein
MMSQFPGLENPALFLTAYHGDLGIDGGVPQNIYQLDDERMDQFKTKDGKPFSKKLVVGDEMKLPNGAGTLKFEGIERWAGFQITKRTGNMWALGGALAAIAGLAGSLFIQRRRVFVRASKGDDGRTVVELGALGRSESARLPEELGRLAATLHEEAPTAASPSPSPSSPDPTESAATDEGARA